MNELICGLGLQARYWLKQSHLSITEVFCATIIQWWAEKKIYSVWFTNFYMEKCSALQLQFPQLDFDETAGCCFYGIKSLVISIDFRFYFTWIQDVRSIESHSGRGHAQCLNFYLLHFRFLNVPIPLNKYFIQKVKGFRYEPYGAYQHHPFR